MVVSDGGWLARASRDEWGGLTFSRQAILPQILPAALPELTRKLTIQLGGPLAKLLILLSIYQKNRRGVP